MNPKALWQISYGMYVVSSKLGDKYNGQIANTVFQVTSKPVTVVVSICKTNFTHDCIADSKVFSVAILAQKAPMTFIGTFGFKCGREIDKFKDVKYKIGKTGAPVALDYTVGYLEAEVINSIDVGTHTIYIGKVVDANVFSQEEPMTYAYYHEIKGGSAPQAAPTYQPNPQGTGQTAAPEPNQPKETITMAKYKCTICGYIYDPEKGDPDSGVKPGTPFEQIPDDWACPICGADKSAFEKIG